MKQGHQDKPAKAGALDSDFALERKKSAHLTYRWQTRAAMVHEAAQRILGRTQSLSLLDLGAADGMTLRYLDNLLPGSRFVGIEYSARLAAMAGELPDNIELVVSDIDNLPASVREGAYDIISALAVIEHLENPGEVFRLAHEMLKPGGVLVVSCPNPVWERISVALGLLDDEHHIQHLKTKHLTEMAKEAGFGRVVNEMFMFAPVGFLPYLKIPVGITFGRTLDRAVNSLKIFNWTFVNQGIVAVK